MRSGKMKQQPSLLARRLPFMWLLLPALLAGAARPDVATAQETVSVGNVSDAVQRRIQAPYLSEDERADLRVHHGVWLAGDLASPARRARAALASSVYDDPSLDDESAAIEDRAQARLLRGDLEDAITLLAGAQSVRARRLCAQALETLGRLDEADAAIDPIVQSLQRREAQRASDLVEGVRALMIRARLRGQPAQDYQRMMTLLARARDELDRFSWRASLTEAMLLRDKDNRPEAIEALKQAIRLNPRCARAWAMRGELAVDSFNFDAAQAAARTLDQIAIDMTGDEHAFSPWADLVLAHAWLRQNDPDLAAQELAPTLERFPKMRAALAMQCAIAAVRYDFKETERLLSAFDELSPGSPTALLAVGSALAQTRQYEQAADYLERASTREKNWPPPLIELGLLEMQSGRDARAAAALRRVAKLDPFNKRAANSLVLLEELLTYETVESEHFIVRFRPGVDRVMAEDMLAPLERNHDIVTRAMDFVPASRTVIELMPDHEWFAVRITGMPALHTIAASTGPVIAMEVPKIGPDHFGRYDWVRVLRHEYVHTVTLARTNNRIPHWFTEAAAVSLELAPRDYSTCRLLVDAIENDRLFDMKAINIAFVRPKKKTDRSLAYAQGHWMYELITQRYGPRAPLDLMDLYAQGLREDEAMRSVLGVSQEAFFESFKQWAVKEARSWGMLAKPTIGELIVREALATADGRADAEAQLKRFAASVGFAAAGAGSVAEYKSLSVPVTRELVDRWLEETPAHPDVLELAIRLALKRSEGDVTPELAPLLERYAKARPVDPEPHRLLARLDLASPDAPSRLAAIEHLAYLDVREQHTAAFAVKLAELYRRTGDLDKASASAERATQIAPFDAGNRELAATIALLQKNYAVAERHIKALTVLEPDQSIHARRLERLRELRREPSD